MCWKLDEKKNHLYEDDLYYMQELCYLQILFSPYISTFPC